MIYFREKQNSFRFFEQIYLNMPIYEYLSNFLVKILIYKSSAAHMYFGKNLRGESYKMRII